MFAYIDYYHVSICYAISYARTNRMFSLIKYQRSLTYFSIFE